MSQQAPNTQNTPKVIYLLYLVNIMIQFLGIIGVVIAYVYRDEAPDWQKSHYQFLIRTFWIGSALLVLGGVTFMLGIGAFILVFWLIWIVVRCVKGMKYLDQQRPHPNPTTWLFS